MDINAIRNQLRINRHRLDEELELQAYVAEQISTEVAKLKARVDASNEAVKESEATLVLDMRDEGGKQTVAEMTARIQRDRGHKTAVGTLQAQRHELMVWEGLQEAWKQRSFALRNLAGLYSSDYFAQATQSITGDKPKARETEYQSGRSALAATRSSSLASSEPEVKPRVRRRVDE